MTSLLAYHCKQLCRLYIVIPVVLLVAPPSVLSNKQLPDEQALLIKLFPEKQNDKYDKRVRPVYNSSKNVEVLFGFTLMQMDMDEKNKLVVLNAWLEMIWKDGRIHWGREDYNGLEMIRLPERQDCAIKFSSWSYDKAQVDLINKTEIVELSRYVTNGELILTRNRIMLLLTIQRRTVYYMLNILISCFWLNILSVLTFCLPPLTFCLPPDTGEKITLSNTVLFAYSVFMLLVAECMPPTAEFFP